MLDFAAAQPVGEIVARFPAASRVFARLSIDFCCGGRKPLKAACSERGLAVKRLERTALDGSAAIDPLCGSIAYPIRAMEHEHVEAAGHLAELRRLTDGYRIPDGACGTVISLIAGLEELESELHRHIHLENEILFPRAEELAQSQRHPEEATL